ncbi:MAG: prepilin peptidase [Leptospirillum sp.]
MVATWGLALAVMAVATYYDLRWRVIPNWLIVVYLLLTLPIVLLSGGLWLHLGAAVLVFVALALLANLVGGIGGGDVKLIAATILLLGPLLGIWVWVLSLTLACLGGLVLICTGRRPRVVRLPMAPYFLLGTILSIFIFPR